MGLGTDPDDQHIISFILFRSPRLARRKEGTFSTQALCCGGGRKEISRRPVHLLPALTAFFGYLPRNDTTTSVLQA